VGEIYVEAATVERPAAAYDRVRGMALAAVAGVRARAARRNVQLIAGCHDAAWRPFVDACPVPLAALRGDAPANTVTIGGDAMSADLVTADGKSRVLADGTEIPLLGLAVWQVPNGRDCADAVRWALELGYRHIDTAQAYGNEESVGQGLRESGVPREEVYITTKFFPGRTDPAAEAERSVQRLGVDYVDLYLIHWPEGGPTWAWPGMEKAHELGYTRSIGVSNFSVDDLRQLLETAVVPPVVNQVQFSPYEHRKALLDSCGRSGIALEAYSPLGTGRHLGSDTVTRIARRHDRTPAQVLLRWGIERAVPVIPKSTHRERIAENAQLFDFRLTDDDIAELDALDRTGGTDRALERPWWRS
jgi:2,5-diketo-D-gluconate reductase A